MADLFPIPTKEEARTRKVKAFKRENIWLFKHINYWFEQYNQPILTAEETDELIDYVLFLRYNFAFTSSGILVISNELKKELSQLRTIEWEELPLDSAGTLSWTSRVRD